MVNDELLLTGEQVFALAGKHLVETDFERSLSTKYPKYDWDDGSFKFPSDRLKYGSFELSYLWTNLYAQYYYFPGSYGFYRKLKRALEDELFHDSEIIDWALDFVISLLADWMLLKLKHPALEHWREALRDTLECQIPVNNEAKILLQLRFALFCEPEEFHMLSDVIKLLHSKLFASHWQPGLEQIVDFVVTLLSLLGKRKNEDDISFSIPWGGDSFTRGIGKEEPEDSDEGGFSLDDYELPELNFNESEYVNRQLEYSVSNVITADAWFRHFSEDTQTFNAIWRPGDPIHKLDWQRSYRISPVLVPGVTTIQRKLRKRSGQPRQMDRMNLMIVIDDSGSMGGPSIQAVRNFVYSILLSSQRSGMSIEIGFLVFGHGIVHELPLSARQFESAKELLSKLHGSAGGTFLLPVARRLNEEPYINNLTHVFFFTDAMAGDWEGTEPYLLSVAKKAEMTMFLINEQIPEELNNLSNALTSSFHVFQVDPLTGDMPRYLKELTA